jgi:hypothetical protein
VSNERTEERRESGRTGENDENTLLLENVELSNARDGDDLDGHLVLLAKIGEVDSVVGTVDHAVPIVCFLFSSASSEKGGKRKKNAPKGAAQINLFVPTKYPALSGNVSKTKLLSLNSFCLSSIFSNHFFRPVHVLAQSVIW